MAAASLIVILAITMLIGRIATVALQLTGLSRETARFQTRSALTGAGFTTAESEWIVNHPVRRRIIMMLMLTGNAGIVSVLGSLTLSVVTIADHAQPWRGWLVMGAGLLMLALIACSDAIDRVFGRVITWALTRWTDLDARDYSHLLHLSDGYGVLEVQVGSGLANRALECAHLAREGIVVLGIQSPRGRYEGAPGPGRVLREGESVWLYGRTRDVREVCGAHLPIVGS